MLYRFVKMVVSNKTITLTRLSLFEVRLGQFLGIRFEPIFG